MIVVNNTADLPDLHPGDGRCRAANGRCTLRAAVQEANALPRHSAILVNPGVYTLTRHGLDDTADRGDLDLHFDGEVVGSGQGRTVVDGNVITGGGVTAGIDLALQVVAEIAGRDAAEAIQLAIEYDPRPPFDAGSPSRARQDLVRRVARAAEPMLRERAEQVRRAAAALDEAAPPR